MSDDPTVIKSLAVKADAVITALELTQTSERNAVLRVTPPFSGRMRARIHAGDHEYTQNPEPIHIQPETLVDTSLPAVPRPAETEDELRTDPDETYTVERHHDRHREAVEQWRQAVPEAIQDRIEIETPDGLHAVDLTVLGTGR